MRNIKGTANKIPESRKLLRAAEKELAEVIQHNPELGKIIDGLVIELAALYDTSIADIRQHVNLGVQVSLGFDYSNDFVKEKMRQHPLTTQLQPDAKQYQRLSKQEELLKYKEESKKKLENNSFFRKLVLIGKLIRG